MRMVQALLAGALIAVSGAPAVAASSVNERGEARLAKILEGRVAGKPVDCLFLPDIQSSEIVDGTAILYRTSGNRLYVNRPRSGASTLDRDDILVTKTSTSQLCRIDTVQLLDRTSHFFSGFVALGEFVPYTKADAR